MRRLTIENARMRRKRPRVIGLISDTHGLVRPRAAELLAGVDAIVHAGDIGKREVLDELERIAPTYAIRGNVDRDRWAHSLPDLLRLELGRWVVQVVHDVNTFAGDAAAAGVSVVVSGHSHQPSMRESNGVWWVNPGSAGPRRFKLPVAIGRLHLGAHGSIEPEIIELQV